MEETFNIYNDLTLAKEKFEKAEKNYAAALELFEKVFKDIMPKFWQATYIFADNRFLIIHYSHTDETEESPLMSFKHLCEALSAAGYSLKKEISDMGKDYVFLNAFSHYEKDDVKFEIHIRQCQVDKCEIEYTEVTKKEAKLSGFCAEVLK